MLTLEYIMKVGRLMNQTGRPPDDPLTPYTPALSLNYQPKPEQKIVKINLDYELGSNGDVRIVQK